jgi:hypothetical protein
MALARKRRALSPESRRTIEEIYSACDEEFGGQFRNEAIARADELIGNYEVDRPKTAVQGLRLMRKVYAEVAAKHRPKEEPRPAARTPRELSVTALEDSEEFKPGPLDQVKADMAAKMEAGTWNREAFASPV